MVEKFLINLWSGFFMGIFSIYVLDFKWDKKYRIFDYLIATLFYLLVEYFSHTNHFFLQAATELVMIAIVLILFNKGSLWRNYFIVVLCYIVQNLFFLVCFSLSDSLRTAYTGELTGERTLDMSIVMMDFVIRGSAAIFVCLVFPRFISKSYYGNDKLYKFLISFYFIILLVTKRSQVEEISRTGIYLIRYSVEYIIFVFLFVLLASNLYNWYEMRRITQQKNKLERLVQDNYKRLENDLINPCSSQNLSGNLVLDSVVAGYSDLFRQKGIIFESMIQEGERLDDCMGDMVMLLEELLSVGAYATGKLEKEAFVWLSVRIIHGTILVKMNFSKCETDHFGKKRWWHLDKQMENMRKKLQMVSKLAESRSGLMCVKEQDSDCEIQLVLMQ